MTTSAPPELEVIEMTKRFGSFTALEDVSLRLPPGEFHALLGENGAGKSTLVKCIMGFYHADQGTVMVDQREVEIETPKNAQDHALGMVYQHFTLVDNMTVAENLVMAQSHLPSVIQWKQEIESLHAFMQTMPFQVPLEAYVRDLAAGIKQKAEILKQLYLKNRILILDEPTSVLTPQEADEMLGLIREMTQQKQLSVLMITHKFREVEKFADAVTILRRGKRVGGGRVGELTRDDMASMMIGSETLAQPTHRSGQRQPQPILEVNGLFVDDDNGTPAVKDLSFQLYPGEILGVAGVSGNGQPELVEVLAGQRQPLQGTVKTRSSVYSGRRAEMRNQKFYCLPEEPLRNACVGTMSVAHNMVLRNFDVSPFAWGGWLLNHRAIRRQAEALIQKYRVKTPTPETQIQFLSGGNIQRAVLARELSNEVDILVVANPCFGLDFGAIADIHSQLMTARNNGVAVLLISEDLDEIIELADRVVVMSGGAFNYESTIDQLDLQTVGNRMAGH